jgi:hypothetical protein
MKKQKKVEKKRAPTWKKDWRLSFQELISMEKNTDESRRFERDYEKRFGIPFKALKKRTKKSNIRKK